MIDDLSFNPDYTVSDVLKQAIEDEHKLEEENTRLKTSLKEAEERILLLRGVINSKYSTFPDKDIKITSVDDLLNTGKQSTFFTQSTLCEKAIKERPQWMKDAMITPPKQKD